MKRLYMFDLSLKSVVSSFFVGAFVFALPLKGSNTWSTPYGYAQDTQTQSTSSSNPASASIKDKVGSSDQKEATQKSEQKEQKINSQGSKEIKQADPQEPKDTSSMTQEQIEALIASSDPKLQLKALWLDFKSHAHEYIRHAKAQHQTHRRIFQIRYQKNIESVEARYTPKIKEIEMSEDIERKQSIKQFRDFIESHPPHPQYTPDSLYRLSMLLLEDVDARYLKAMDEYNRALEEASQNENEDEADEMYDRPVPQRVYTEVISKLDRLIERWPNYRDLDSAIYARAHSHFEGGDEQKALQDFQMIARRFPNSDYRTEVWNMIGEIHFNFAELPEAIRAYKEVVKDQESQYYMGAYYKLAWTYYRNDQYEDAVQHFKRLVQYSDRRKEEGKRPFELRNEALQYLAISLQEEDWDDDGLADSMAGVKRVRRYIDGKQKYHAELLAKVIEIFFDTSKYEDAIATAQYLFQMNPFYRNNPSIHFKVVNAYNRIAQPEKAFVSRDQITEDYVKDGPWYAYNHKDQLAIDQARSLMKDALLQTGSYHHENAQGLRQRSLEMELESDRQNLMRQARQSYQKAALSYQRYLDRYKQDENTYELYFMYAEASFYSQQYRQALTQYLRVRDFKADTSRREESAFSVVLSHMNLVDQAVQARQLPLKPSLLLNPPENLKDSSASNTTSTDQDPVIEDQVQKPTPLPPLVEEAIRLRLDYINLEIEAEETPQRKALFIYQIGEIYADFQQYEKARDQFKRVLQDHLKSKVALNAAVRLIDTYQKEKNWKKVAEWADKIAAAGIKGELASQAKIWKVGALFKTAEQLYNDKKYAQAGKEYIKLVDQNPENEFAANALNNGAVAFEKARMFESATRVYERIYRQFPGSQYSENALFRVAYNSERFYNYDKAVETFNDLVERYPEGKHVEDASYNVARLFEQTQQYKRAAKAYERFSSRFAESEYAADTLYSAATNYEKLGDTRNQTRIYGLFRKRFGENSKYNNRMIEILAKIVEIRKKQKRRKPINKARLDLIEEFEERKIPVGGYIASLPAQSAFELIEPRFQKFMALQIKGSQSQQGKIIKKMIGEIAELTNQYSDLLKYKALDWSIAAFYRIGLLRQVFAQRLYDIPMPKGLTLEEQDIYLVKIEETAAPIEDEAVKRFEFAYQKARQFRVSNQWTEKILLSLNQYKPSEYPTFKKEKRLEVKGLMTTAQFVIPKQAKELLEGKKKEKPSSKSSPTGSESSASPSSDPASSKSTLGQKKPKIPKPTSSSSSQSTSSSQSQKTTPPSSSDSSSDLEDLEL